VRELAKWGDLAGQPVEAIREYIAEWHRLALPNIGTKPFMATWREAVDAWRTVDPAKGSYQAVVAAGLTETDPACVAELNYADDPPTVRLVKACRALQRHRGSRPFYLSCRLAAEIMGCKRTIANQTLRVLCVDGVLELVRRGDLATRRASEYRYTAGE